MSFLLNKRFLINKTLRLNNLKNRTAMNEKMSVFIYVEAIMHLLLYNLHDCTFKKKPYLVKNMWRHWPNMSLKTVKKLFQFISWNIIWELIIFREWEKWLVKFCNVHKKTCSKISKCSQGNICVRIFIKMRLQHRCFPVKIAKFLRTAFL